MMTDLKKCFRKKSTPKESINIANLKKFALENLPKNSPLREILIAENEQIDRLTFLARLPIWLQLSKFKRGDNR